MSCLVVLAALGACGGSQQADVDPEQTATQAAERRVERGVERAVVGAADIGEFHSELRFVPAPCECPSWEVFMAGRWVRAEVRADRAAAADVETLLRSPVPGTFAAEVRLTSDSVGSGTGWLYPVVELVALGG